MTTPVWVGFFVNNASGATGTNTCTFTSLSIAPLNKAPAANPGTVASDSISPVNLAGSVTDDDYPPPPSLAAEWSAQSGPASVSFGNATSPVTTAAFATPGVYRLRLTGDDTSAVTFQDLTFNGYTRSLRHLDGTAVRTKLDEPRFTLPSPAISISTT